MTGRSWRAVLWFLVALALIGWVGPVLRAAVDNHIWPLALAGLGVLVALGVVVTVLEARHAKARRVDRGPPDFRP